MGYSHYWDVNKPFTKTNWSKFCQEANEVFASSEIALANGTGSAKTKPSITKNHINFNGVGEDSYEDCTIRRATIDSFWCKTDRRPYDKIVIQILKLARKYNPSIVLMSDGGKDIFRD